TTFPLMGQAVIEKKKNKQIASSRNGGLRNVPLRVGAETAISLFLLDRRHHFYYTSAMPRLGARSAFFFLLLLLFSFRRLPGQDAPKIGEAALLEAENQVATRKKGAAWMPSKPLLPLAVGDGVQTGELSRAAVRLTDLSVLRMNEFTTIEILPREKLTASEG